MRDAADFLRRLIEAVPYKVHTVLTDNGTHFTDPAGNTRSAAPTSRPPSIAEQKPVRAHAFEYACAQNDIDHRLTKPKHPWTTWASRKNESHDQGRHRQTLLLRNPRPRCATYLRDFVNAYNFARSLKTLKALTPYEFVCKA